MWTIIVFGWHTAQCSASLLRSATYTQGPARSLGQPAGYCRPIMRTADRPTIRPIAWSDCHRSKHLHSRRILPQLQKNVIIFVTTNPIDVKTNRSPGHGCHASGCQISPSYDAAFRRSLETEKNKQTVNYYIITRLLIICLLHYINLNYHTYLLVSYRVEMSFDAALWRSWMENCHSRIKHRSNVQH